MRFTLEVVDPTALDLFEDIERSLQRFGETKLVERSAKTGRVTPDGFLTIKTPKSSSRYACKAQRQVNSQTFPSVIARLKDLASEAGLKSLLLTDYVNPNLSDELKSSNVAYIDRVGNALLVDPPLLVWLRGFKPVQKASRTARAFQGTGLRLIAFLLKTPDAINWPYRKLGEEAGLSLGSISRILSDLRSLGFISLIGPERNALTHRESLFEQWEFGYVSRMRPSLRPQTFRQAAAGPIEDLSARLPASMRDEVLVGGELAATIATRHLRPQSVTLHVPPHRPMLPLLKALRLIPDPQGNVTVLEQLGTAGVWRWEAFGSANLVHPLLVHAELLQGQSDDRLRETARIIYDQYLTPTLNDEPATLPKGA